MTKDEIKHINWMYNRLTSVHKENPNTDYMIRFKEIIDKQLTLCGVVSTFFCKDEDLQYSSKKCKEQCSGCKWIENL